MDMKQEYSLKVLKDWGKVMNDTLESAEIILKKDNYHEIHKKHEKDFSFR
jgi:hypothetical protein